MLCYNGGMSELAFEGQREGESVELVFRRHFLTFRGGLGWLIVVGALGFLPILMWPHDTRMFWVFAASLGLGFIGFLYACMLWYFSVYIVTDQRIRQISQKGLFRKTVVDLGLNKIQTIAYNIPGVGGGLLQFGTILIQTQVGDMKISMVYKPEKVYNELQKIVGRVENEQEA